MYVNHTRHGRAIPADRTAHVDGFILDENRWDNLPVDDLLLEITHNEPARSILEESQNLGAYTLSSDGVCYRTYVAIRATTMKLERWQSYVDGVLEDGAEDKAADQEIERLILQPYHEEAQVSLRHLENSNEVPGPIKATLKRRWGQILDIVLCARKSMLEGS